MFCRLLVRGQVNSGQRRPCEGCEGPSGRVADHGCGFLRIGASVKSVARSPPAALCVTLIFAQYVQECWGTLRWFDHQDIAAEVPPPLPWQVRRQSCPVPLTTSSTFTISYTRFTATNGHSAQGEAQRRQMLTAAPANLNTSRSKGGPAEVEDQASRT